MKYCYIKKIMKINLYLINNNIIKTIDVTEQIIPFVGQNYDFNNSYKECEMLVKDYLNVLNIDYNENTLMKIYDKFNIEYVYNINSILKWNPNIN